MRSRCSLGCLAAAVLLGFGEAGRSGRLAVVGGGAFHVLEDP